MAHKDLLLKPPTPRERAYRHRAIIASLAIHTTILVFVLVVDLFFHEEIKHKNGAPLSEATITLSTMVVVSPPPPAPPTPPVPEKPTPPTPPTPPTTPPPPTPPVPPTPETSVAVSTPPPVPELKPPPPENALPVLPPTPPTTHPTHTVAQKKFASHPPPPSHPVASTSTTHTQSPTTRQSAASTYTPGPSDLPHPPYPIEAQSEHKTGTVLLNVAFNHAGRVTSAEVVQSSGVPILDSSTRSFILTNWHCLAYAGQTISVPVQYQLENL